MAPRHLVRLAGCALVAAATVGCAQQPVQHRDDYPLLYQPALQRTLPTGLIPDSLRVAAAARSDTAA